MPRLRSMRPETRLSCVRFALLIDPSHVRPDRQQPAIRTSAEISRLGDLGGSS